MSGPDVRPIYGSHVIVWPWRLANIPLPCKLSGCGPDVKPIYRSHVTVWPWRKPMNRFPFQGLYTSSPSFSLSLCCGMSSAGEAGRRLGPRSWPRKPITRSQFMVFTRIIKHVTGPTSDRSSWPWFGDLVDFFFLFFNLQSNNTCISGESCCFAIYSGACCSVVSCANDVIGSMFISFVCLTKHIHKLINKSINEFMILDGGGSPELSKVASF